jgi:chromosome segregation ATPase
VGKAITAAKRIQIRSFFHFLNDAVTQVNGALASMRAALDAETRAREALEDRVRELEAELDELHAAKEASEHG